MKTIVAVSLLGFGMVWGMAIAPLQAQESETADSEAAGQPASPAESPKPSPAPATSPDIFIPSEEISEDFAVPFPVDI